MFKQLDEPELDHIGYNDKMLMFPETDAVSSNACKERTGKGVQAAELLATTPRC